ncbi:MAG: S8 family serine peptidase [Planctomycetota bacterium]|nr:S8 family serine peptidase [Planctomycetota bacterium]
MPTTTPLLAVLLCLSSASAPALPHDRPLVERSAGETHLSLPGGAPFHRTSAEVSDERLIPIPGGPGWAAVWSEDPGGGKESWCALSLDGELFSRARATTFDLHLKRARFDPLLDAPDLSSSPLETSSGVYIVQFHTLPLEAYRADLRARGAAVHHFLADNAHLVRMTATLAAEVAGLPHVRWVGPYHPEFRLEPWLLEQLAAGTLGGALRCYVQVFEKGARQKELVAARIRELGGTIETLYPDGYRLEATLNAAQLARVATFEEVLFIDRWSPPEADLNHVRTAGGANQLENSTGFTGQGVTGECCDSGVRESHNAFQSNPILIHGSDNSDNDHGTKVTGCVFGDGTGQTSARGLLPDGQPVFASFYSLGNRYQHTAQLLASPYFAVFQTNSWGGSLTTSYNSTSMEMDDILFDFDITITQSQSNSGNQQSRPQAWAKNIIACGGVRHQNDSNLNNDAWSGTGSIGPAADGRVKPDLCFWYDSIWTTDNESNSDYTTGFGGTSASTPCVAGHVGLVQQMWSEGVFGNEPIGSTVFERRAKATTVRALLVNSATSYSFSGTGHDLTRTHQGWGLPDVGTLHDRRDELFVVDETDLLTHLQSKSYSLEVEPGQGIFKATLVYLDPAGTTSSSLHRINDLSLRATSPTGVTYWGNNGLLAGNWSTSGGASNTIDVIENVFVQNPTAGVWILEVFADEINADNHVETGAVDVDFALAVSGVRETSACDDPLPYCSAKTTSMGLEPQITWSGDASLSQNDLEILVQNAIPNQAALAFFSDSQNNLPFMGGTLCLAPPFSRTWPVQTDLFGDGAWLLDISDRTAGATQFYQVWFRDPADPTGFGVGLTAALAVTYCE